MTTDIHIQRPLDKISAKEWRAKYKELFNWDRYQLSIFEWIQNGSGNAMVGAVAGSGKSSTITGIIAALPATSKIQISAFNRHIAQKLKDDSRIPKGRVTVGTAHSFGMSLLTSYFGGNLFGPDERKYFRLSKDAVQQILRERVKFEIMVREKPEEVAEQYPVQPPPLTAATHQAELLAKEMRKFIQDIADFARLTLTPLRPKDLTAMIDHFGIEIPDAEGALSWGIHEAIKVLGLGEKLASEQQCIDFGDMLWLPNKWNLTPAQKDFLIVDEAQDANAAMIGLYQRVAAQGARVILLGDERQAIFGFSGSDANSWQSLRAAFNPSELPLSVCYRCPSSHLNLARRIVPQIEDRPNCIKGSLEVLHPDLVFEMAAPDDLILCRLTAPLIELCLKLIIRGEVARVRGRDLGQQLASLAEKASGDHRYPSEFSQALVNYCNPRIAALRESGEESEAENLSDRYYAIRTCFEAFGSEYPTLEEFCERIKSLFTDDTAAIILSTFHRAKGDQAKRVFLLGTNFLPFLFKSTKAWQVKQEWNLVYVALTRAETHLYLVPIARNDQDREQLPTHLKHPLGGMQLPEYQQESATEVEELPDVGTTPQAKLPTEVAVAPHPALEVEVEVQVETPELSALPAPLDSSPVTQIVEYSNIQASHLGNQTTSPSPQVINQDAPQPEPPLPEATADAVALNQDEWLTHENLQDMAEMFCACEDSETLGELRKIWPAYALTAACRLLDADKRQQIKEWVIEQNSQSAANAIALTKQPELLSAAPAKDEEWIPMVGEQVLWLHFDTWRPATITRCPATDFNKWEVRLDSGFEVYVWNIEEMRRMQ